LWHGAAEWTTYRHIFMIVFVIYYHKYLHKLELVNSEPSVAGCIFYEKLPNNTKQIENKIQFTRELKKLLIKGC
jgi:hypothetical protein